MTSSTPAQVFFDEEVAPAILDVIRKAKREFIVVSPYIKLWPEAKDAIQRALRRNVQVRFVVRFESERKLLANDDLSWLDENNIEWIPYVDLHAKIYLNEDTVLLSSMNLYEYSARNNLEFCYLVTERKSKDAIREWVDSFWEPEGYCIRCGDEIEWNPYKPLCYKDYKIWNRYGDPDYREKFCHNCGEPRRTSKADPVCDRCDQELAAMPSS